jgi:hypothetical protein
MKNPMKCVAFLLLQLTSATVARPSEEAPAAKPIVVEAKGGGRTSYWLESSLKRVFPATAPGSATLQVLAARNSRTSFQACVRNDRAQPLGIECTIEADGALKPRVRWVELVPVRHRTPHTDSERRGERATPGGVADGRPKRITPLV